MILTDAYQQKVAAGTLQNDPEQHVILQYFDHLQQAMNGYNPRPKWQLSGLFGIMPPRPRGLYIFGGVGCGKSMLMDLFYRFAPVKKKYRVHFHSFMQSVQDSLNQVRKTGAENAIKPVAEKLAKNLTLLCLDEMQINDIANAMIVGRLFEYLIDAGVIIVTTSNRPPTDLYKNGLNRILFLPFINLLNERLDIHKLVSNKDYRRERLKGESVYFFPNTPAQKAKINQMWQNMTQNSAAPLTLIHKGRNITLPQFHNGVAMVHFNDLCAKPLAAGDYLHIIQNIRVIFLIDIPILTPAKNNEAKRFVTLIDTLYEAKNKLIISAAAPPESLYVSGRGAFEFNRTVSRLYEMQSQQWLQTNP